MYSGQELRYGNIRTWRVHSGHSADAHLVWGLARRAAGPFESTFFFPIALLSTPSLYSTQQTETMVKRKHESNGTDANVPVKKAAKSQAEVHANFGDKLFDTDVVTKYREDYAQSGPYVAPDICLYSQI